MKSPPALLVIRLDGGPDIGRQATETNQWEIVECPASDLAAVPWASGVQENLRRAAAIVVVESSSNGLLDAMNGDRAIVAELASVGMLLAVHQAPAALLCSEVPQKQAQTAAPFDRLELVSPATLPTWIAERSQHYEAEQEHEAALAQLSARGYAPSPAGLANAAKNDDEDSVRNFLTTGVSPNAPNAKGVPPLHVAIRAGAANSVAVLLEHAVDVDAIASDRGSTPVAEAVGVGNQEVLETLIARGADIRTPNATGQSPLMIAIGRKDEASALLLLDAGAEATGKDALGMSAHSYAKLFGLSAVLARIAPET